MMRYIDKKQKTKIVVIIFIIVLGFCFYVYKTRINNEISIENQNLEIEENVEEENNDKIKENKNIIVHISGAVNKEGIVELEENSRVADAIELAGGMKENAYTKNINLAEILEDGMKIYIPTNEEVEESKENSNYITDTSVQNTIENNKSEINKNNKININTASKEELDMLPGVGESTATKIINYRNENGKFESIEEIKEVSGIGESKYEQIKELIEI